MALVKQTSTISASAIFLPLFFYGSTWGIKWLIIRSISRALSPSSSGLSI